MPLRVGQLPAAVSRPAGCSSIVQSVAPPFCTVTDPVGAPVVPEVTVAEITTEPSSPYEVDEGAMVSETELVAGKTESGVVVDDGRKLASPG